MKSGVGGASRKHSVVAKLDVLLEEEPSPTPEVAAIWADVLALGVFAKHILTYALLREVKRHVAENETVCAATSTKVSLGFVQGSSSFYRFSDYADRCRRLRVRFPQPVNKDSRANGTIVGSRTEV